MKNSPNVQNTHDLIFKYFKVKIDNKDGDPHIGRQFYMN